MLEQKAEAERLYTSAERNSDEWRSWRQSEEWREWNEAAAPVVAARRRALTLLGDKKAVKVLFEEVAPRFADRDGGYTRILRLAKPRLGDAGTRPFWSSWARTTACGKKSQRPVFDSDAAAPQTAPAAE